MTKPTRKKISPILSTSGALPNVESVDELGALLVVTGKLLAAFARHKVFKILNFYFNVTVDTFIRHFFRYLSFADFAVGGMGRK